VRAFPTYLLSFIAASAFASAQACSGGHTATPKMAADGDGGSTTVDASAAGLPSMPALPFQADPPAVYVAKVKNVLAGLPPTDDEVKAVEADPTQLRALIDTWMALPQYQQKMQRFFQLAFQQTQVSIIDFADQAYPRQAESNPSTQASLVQNATESFARTVLELVAEGRPFTETVTTHRFMMTPALMELYAFFDAWQVDDASKVTDSFKKANPTLSISVGATQGPIPMTQSLDPTSANYMHFYDPDVANAVALTGTGCGQDPITYPAAADTLHNILYGTLLTRKNPSGGTCGQYGGTAASTQFLPTDFTTWKMVTIRPPAAGEATTAFYDLPTLRSTNELVLSLPRVGFFSTPAFFANWQTNTSNQMRVTMNQALIVALGAAVDGTDPTAPSSTPGLDMMHSSQAACVACHQTLDPTRSILSSTYSWYYHDQTETTYGGQRGLFAFQGVIQPVGSVTDLGNVLAQHPRFAPAWANKLCYYANSQACALDDPEFQRVVGVFVSSGMSWSALVREIMASPLTTNAAPTQTTTQSGEVVAVSRRDHLCAALDARLGFADVCGRDAIGKAAPQATIVEIVPGLPSDGYGRGAVAPVLPNQPTLFFRAATENICEGVASLVIDVPSAQQKPGVKQWSSAQPDAAITDFLQIVMALTPSDARYAQAQTLLKSHFTAAEQSGASATDALKSVFVAACLAPSAVSIGL